MRPPDSKTMCSMGTYLGFILVFQSLGLLIPLVSWPLLIISWMVSATYLQLLPIRDWIKTRAIIEAMALGSYYKNTVELNEFLRTMNLGSVNVLMGFFNRNAVQFSPIEIEQLAWVIDDSLSKIGAASNTAFLLPFVSVLIKYSIIVLMYLYLRRIDFFRRIMV